MSGKIFLLIVKIILRIMKIILRIVVLETGSALACAKIREISATDQVAILLIERD